MYYPMQQRDVVFSFAHPLMASNPFESSRGSVRCLPAGSEWPSHAHQPMLPICQINLQEIAKSPAPLAGLDFLWVFAPASHGYVQAPFDGNWVIIASRGKNVQAINPLRTASAPRRLIWSPMQQEHRYLSQEGYDSGVKLGGHPSFTQDDTPWIANNSDQIVEIDSAFFQELDTSGDSTVVYIFRERGTDTFWAHSESC